MKSDLPKPLVPLNGKPIVGYIIDAFHEAGVEDVVLVVGYKAQNIKDEFLNRVQFAEQLEQNGTAHAVMMAEKLDEYAGKNVFVFVGDSPLITSETIKKLLEHHVKTDAACTFLTADFPDMDLPYGRVIKDENGNLIKCVEEIDATEEEKKVRELLTSHFVFKGDVLFKYLKEIQPNPKSGELYLTDIIDLLLKNGLKVETLKIKESEQLVGLNTPEDVQWAENLLSKKELV